MFCYISMNLCLTAKTGTSRGTQAQLDLGTSYNVYLGGYSGVESQHRFPDVTNDRYDGCMRKLKLGSNGRDLSDNLVGAVTRDDKDYLTQSRRNKVHCRCATCTNSLTMNHP